MRPRRRRVALGCLGRGPVKRLTGLAVAGVLALLLFPLFFLGGKPPDSSDEDQDKQQKAGTVSGISNAVPTQYRDVVVKAGSICPTITPAVIAAQIEAESNWNPNDVSSVGARGIS